jgi:membrane protein DedA with SNARE-associated domain/membrane-associated phospholipid phosphatase
MELPRKRKDWLKVVAVVVAVVVVYQLVKRALPNVDPQKLLEDASGSLGSWTYLIAGVLAFLETGAFVGLVAPGETVVVLAGAVAGQGDTSVVLTIGVVWLCAFLGDTCSFLLGERLGRDWVLTHGPRLRITPERFKQVESYFASHGGKTILVGRFIGLVRALAPFIAGSSRMPYRQLAPYSVLGTGMWATLFTLLGYFASKNIDAVLSNSEHALLAFALIVALIVAGIVAYRWLKLPANRSKLTAEMERRPVLRSLLALGRRLSPHARFLLDRLTPGGLGLEFTTALAALAVGSYVLVAYALVVGDSPGPTTGDTTVMDVVDRIRVDWLTSLAKVVTALGSGIAVSIAAAATAVWLIVRRAWPELIVLVVGTVAILWGTDLIKDSVERPRPAGGLVEAGGYSYPSGHASHSIVYVWIALTVAIRLRPRMSRGTALLASAIMLAVAIGLSRVYLGVHYMSDVSGGWALGVAIFALLSAIVVVIVHLRQNEADVA